MLANAVLFRFFGASVKKWTEGVCPLKWQSCAASMPKNVGPKLAVPEQIGVDVFYPPPASSQKRGFGLNPGRIAAVGQAAHRWRYILYVRLR